MDMEVRLLWFYRALKKVYLMCKNLSLVDQEGLFTNSRRWMENNKGTFLENTNLSEEIELEQENRMCLTIKTSSTHR